MPDNSIDGWQFVVELIHLYRDVTRIIEHHTGMSQSRLQILHELFHNEELSQAELQERLGVEGAVITRIIKQLEALSLVTRRADPRDNRFTLVALSAEARQNQATDEATRKFKETFGAQLLEGLSEAELAQLLRMMKRIQENAEAIGHRR
jgi:DNA-binding MarR family transcriptional regulator